MVLVKPIGRDILKGMTILAVDDEPDVLESIEEVLDICVVHKAASYDTALEHLKNHRHDVAILDIMGVNGFELLKYTVSKGIPTIMLTAHALSEEALQKSAQLGAVSFLPKERGFISSCSF